MGATQGWSKRARGSRISTRVQALRCHCCGVRRWAARKRYEAVNAIILAMVGHESSAISRQYSASERQRALTSAKRRCPIMFARLKKSSHCCGNSRHCLTDALAKYIRERLEKRTSCTVFENSLARVWPIGPLLDTKRTERIYAFAESNGWAVTINDIGTRAVFKKLVA